jgi:hypothetical protein
MGGRTGAWLFDVLVFGSVMFVVFLLGAALGAVRISPEAFRQASESPGAQPTVPMFEVNTILLLVVAAASVGLVVGLATWCWMRYRATPGQKFLGLQVVDGATGRNLSFGRAFARAVLLLGLWWAGLAVFIVILIELMSLESPATLTETNYVVAPDSPLAPWMGLNSVASSVVLLWPLALMLAAALDIDHRSLHDRVAGSLVVSGIRVNYGRAAGPGSGPQQGMGPGAPYGGYPGWAPAPPAAPGTQPGGTPPQSTDEPSPGETPGPTGLLPGGETPGRGSAPAGWTPPGHSELAPGQGDEIWQTSWDEPTGVRLASARRASFGRRSAAYVLDSVLLWGFYLTMLSLTGAVVTPQTVNEKAAIVAGLLAGAFQILYFVGSWVLWRGSPGQRVLGLEVARATDGQTLGWGDAFVRWGILQGPSALASILPLGIMWLGGISALAWQCGLGFSTLNAPDERGPHDRAVNSRVTLISDRPDRM